MTHSVGKVKSSVSLGNSNNQK